MKLDEARANIGAPVIYSPHLGDMEEGVITGVSDRYVFVRYWSQCPTAAGQATPAHLLRLATNNSDDSEDDDSEDTEWCTTPECVRPVTFHPRGMHLTENGREFGDPRPTFRFNFPMVHGT